MPINNQMIRNHKIEWSGNIGQPNRRFTIESKRILGRLMSERIMTAQEIQNILQVTSTSTTQWKQDYEAGLLNNPELHIAVTRRPRTHVTIVERLQAEVERATAEVETARQRLELAINAERLGLTVTLN